METKHSDSGGSGHLGYSNLQALVAVAGRNAFVTYRHGEAAYSNAIIWLQNIKEITMPNRAFIACITFSVGMFMSGVFDFGVAALVSLAMIAIYSSQAVYNCIKDIEGDKVNASWQPLASGQLSVGFAWKLMAALIVVGMALFWLATPQYVLLGVAFVLLGVFYSAYAKARHFLSYTTLVTTHMAMPMAAGYLLAGHMDFRLAVVIVFIYMTEVLSMSIKDYKDVSGDQRVGLRTLPIVLGTRNASLITFAGFCSPFFLAWIPWLVLHLSPIFLAASLASGAARIILGLRFVASPDSKQGMETLNKFRYVRIAQMLAWCLI